VFPSLEGTRPVLVEVQALVAGTTMPQPRRMSLGIESGRLSMLLAVLERRTEQKLLDKEVYVNVAGGLRIRETAADLPVALALTSSAINRALPDDACAFGEIGLAGEVRSVDRAPQRLREARAMGFRRCLVASGNAQLSPAEVPEGMAIVEVASVSDAIAELWPGVELVLPPPTPGPWGPPRPV
jgi:DNA repair protein RadA/Sms